MKRIMILLVCLFLLTGCLPKTNNDQIVENQENNQKSIIPHYKISDDYYTPILPFEPSIARGLIVGNIASRTDLVEFETGLMRHTQDAFPTNQYFFKEGQYLDRDTISSWLSRKYTDEQLAQKGIDQSKNLGLNPVERIDPNDPDKKTPIYLAHILEHNYYVKEGDVVHLDGIAIGLAMNSREDVGGDDVTSEGKKMAEEIVKRLRANKELKDVKIVIAIYEQAKKDSIIPGNFVAKTTVEKSSTALSEWNNINEQYYLFPSKRANELQTVNAQTFANFKKEVEKYFPNFSGVIGRGLYVDNQLVQMKITIPMQFYGETEVVGFTQYVAGEVLKYFSGNLKLEVNISSLDGQEALIVHEPNEEKPFVYIYK